MSVNAHPDFAALMRGVLGEDVPEELTKTDVRILDATLRVVGESGERNLTMDEVAAASRIGRATIFRRFGSKDALLSRMYAREVRAAFAVIQDAAARASDGIGALVAGFGAAFTWCERHPVALRLSRFEPDIMVQLWRAGDPSGYQVIRALLRSLPNGHPPVEGLTPSALDQISETLARLFFSCMLMDADPDSPWYDERRRDGAARELIEGHLRVAVTR